MSAFDGAPKGVTRNPEGGVKGIDLSRECPFCGKQVGMLPNHLRHHCEEAA